MRPQHDGFNRDNRKVSRMTEYTVQAGRILSINDPIPSPVALYRRSHPLSSQQPPVNVIFSFLLCIIITILFYRWHNFGRQIIHPLSKILTS